MSKSGVGGVLLTEAKYINLSLHFLEQVGHVFKTIIILTLLLISEQ